MGILDDAKDLLSEHQDSVADGIEKARDLAKEKAPGNADATIDAVADKAQDLLGGLSREP
jgi:hypothetical protein